MTAERKLDNETTEILANWLIFYTNDIVTRVMGRLDDILNSEAAMQMLRELKEREDAERKEFTSSLRLLGNSEEYRKTFIEHGLNIHNHGLTHSSSYRDVLYDWYIDDYKKNS